MVRPPLRKKGKSTAGGTVAVVGIIELADLRVSEKYGLSRRGNENAKSDVFAEDALEICVPFSLALSIFAAIDIFMR